LTGITDPTNLRMPYRIYTRRKILTKKTLRSQHIKPKRPNGLRLLIARLPFASRLAAPITINAMSQQPVLLNHLTNS
jgi:hypothetical protein